MGKNQGGAGRGANGVSPYRPGSRGASLCTPKVWQADLEWPARRILQQNVPEQVGSSCEELIGRRSSACGAPTSTATHTLVPSGCRCVPPAPSTGGRCESLV